MTIDGQWVWWWSSGWGRNHHEPVVLDEMFHKRAAAEVIIPWTLHVDPGLRDVVPAIWAGDTSRPATTFACCSTPQDSASPPPPAVPARDDDPWVYVATETPLRGLHTPLEVVGALQPGQWYRVRGTADGWAHVEGSDGTTAGWAEESHLVHPG